MHDIHTEFATQSPRRAHLVVWKKILEGPKKGQWMIGEYGINAWGNFVKRFNTIEEMVEMRDQGNLR